MRANLLISTSIGVVALLALLSTIGWDERAALFPRTIAVVMLLVVIAETVRTLTGPPVPIRARGEDDVDSTAAGRRAAAFVGWLLAFLAAIWVIGFQLGLTVAAIAYLRFAAAEGWRETAVVSAVIFATVRTMEDLLHIPFAPGLVTTLLR